MAQPKNYVIALVPLFYSLLLLLSCYTAAQQPPPTSANNSSYYRPPHSAHPYARSTTSNSVGRNPRTQHTTNATKTSANFFDYRPPSILTSLFDPQPPSSHYGHHHHGAQPPNSGTHVGMSHMATRVTCSFEQNMCGWRQLMSPVDQLDWVRHTGPVGANIFQPTIRGDHTTGYGTYMLLATPSAPPLSAADFISGGAGMDPGGIGGGIVNGNGAANGGGGAGGAGTAAGRQAARQAAVDPEMEPEDILMQRMMNGHFGGGGGGHHHHGGGGMATVNAQYNAAGINTMMSPEPLMPMTMNAPLMMPMNGGGGGADPNNNLMSLLMAALGGGGAGGGNTGSFGGGGFGGGQNNNGNNGDNNAMSQFMLHHMFKRQIGGIGVGVDVGGELQMPPIPSFHHQQTTSEHQPPPLYSYKRAAAQTSTSHGGTRVLEPHEVLAAFQLNNSPEQASRTTGDLAINPSTNPSLPPLPPPPPGFYQPNPHLFSTPNAPPPQPPPQLDFVHHQHQLQQPGGGGGGAVGGGLTVQHPHYPPPPYHPAQQYPQQQQHPQHPQQMPMQPSVPPQFMLPGRPHPPPVYGGIQNELHPPPPPPPPPPQQPQQQQQPAAQQPHYVFQTMMPAPHHPYQHHQFINPQQQLPISFVAAASPSTPTMMVAMPPPSGAPPGTMVNVIPGYTPTNGVPAQYSPPTAADAAAGGGGGSITASLAAQAGGGNQVVLSPHPNPFAEPAAKTGAAGGGTANAGAAGGGSEITIIDAGPNNNNMVPAAYHPIAQLISPPIYVDGEQINGTFSFWYHLRGAFGRITVYKRHMDQFMPDETLWEAAGHQSWTWKHAVLHVPPPSLAMLSTGMRNMPFHIVIEGSIKVGGGTPAMYIGIDDVILSGEDEPFPPGINGAGYPPVYLEPNMIDGVPIPIPTTTAPTAPFLTDTLPTEAPQAPAAQPKSPGILKPQLPLYPNYDGVNDRMGPALMGPTTDDPMSRRHKMLFGVRAPPELEPTTTTTPTPPQTAMRRRQRPPQQQTTTTVAPHHQHPYTEWWPAPVTILPPPPPPAPPAPAGNGRGRNGQGPGKRRKQQRPTPQQAKTPADTNTNTNTKRSQRGQPASSGKAQVNILKNANNNNSTENGKKNAVVAPLPDVMIVSNKINQTERNGGGVFVAAGAGATAAPPLLPPTLSLSPPAEIATTFHEIETTPPRVGAEPLQPIPMRFKNSSNNTILGSGNTATTEVVALEREEIAPGVVIVVPSVQVSSSTTTTTVSSAVVGTPEFNLMTIPPPPPLPAAAAAAAVSTTPSTLLTDSNSTLDFIDGTTTDAYPFDVNVTDVYFDNNSTDFSTDFYFLNETTIVWLNMTTTDAPPPPPPPPSSVPASNTTTGAQQQPANISIIILPGKSFLPVNSTNVVGGGGVAANDITAELLLLLNLPSSTTSRPSTTIPAYQTYIEALRRLIIQEQENKQATAAAMAAFGAARLHGGGGGGVANPTMAMAAPTSYHDDAATQLMMMDAIALTGIPALANVSNSGGSDQELFSPAANARRDMLELLNAQRTRSFSGNSDAATALYPLNRQHNNTHAAMQMRASSASSLADNSVRVTSVVVDRPVTTNILPRSPLQPQQQQKQQSLLTAAVEPPAAAAISSGGSSSLQHEGEQQQYSAAHSSSTLSFSGAALVFGLAFAAIVVGVLLFIGAARARNSISHSLASRRRRERHASSSHYSEDDGSVCSSSGPTAGGGGASSVGLPRPPALRVTGPGGAAARTVSGITQASSLTFDIYESIRGDPGGSAAGILPRGLGPRLAGPRAGGSSTDCANSSQVYFSSWSHRGCRFQPNEYAGSSCYNNNAPQQPMQRSKSATLALNEMTLAYDNNDCVKQIHDDAYDNNNSNNNNNFLAVRNNIVPVHGLRLVLPRMSATGDGDGGDSFVSSSL